MSRVTNIVLITACMETEFVNAFNAWLAENRMSELQELATEECGGNKYMEVEVFAGAYNHIPLSESEIIDKAEDLKGFLMNYDGASLVVVPQDGQHLTWKAE